MKIYRVWGARHQTVVFSELETEDDARRKAIESGEIQEWEKEVVGELIVKEIPLPEGWELRRKGNEY